jgi:ABC-2 type transport system ATP-binding protein
MTELRVIEVKGLTKFYANRPAIQDVTFSVPRGQVLGFLGPNGAGKSTTMRILTGYLSASGGTASIDGFDVFEHSLDVRRRVGYLPEMTPLYNDMRVGSYLKLMCRLRGVPPRIRQARIDHAIEVCGMEERRHEIIGRLSRGLRQRVGLAQAVVHDPEVLILDEPTSGLDPSQTRDTRQLIVELGRRHTVILSSHILPEVSATCERVVIINQGTLVADDTPARLADRLSTGRGREVEMVVRGDHADISRRLGQVEGVTAVEIYSLPDGAFQVIVASLTDIRERLAWEAVAAGFGLRELRTRTLSLEQIFLQLTTTEETEDAG